MIKWEVTQDGPNYIIWAARDTKLAELRVQFFMLDGDLHGSTGWTKHSVFVIQQAVRRMLELIGEVPNA